VAAHLTEGGVLIEDAEDAEETQRKAFGDRLGFRLRPEFDRRGGRGLRGALRAGVWSAAGWGLEAEIIVAAREESGG
jgi:hypothetical protein